MLEVALLTGARDALNRNGPVILSCCRIRPLQSQVLCATGDMHGFGPRSVFLHETESEVCNALLSDKSK